jgi:hypothetical protein
VHLHRKSSRSWRQPDSRSLSGLSFNLADVEHLHHELPVVGLGCASAELVQELALRFAELTVTLAARALPGSNDIAVALIAIFAAWRRHSAALDASRLPLLRLRLFKQVNITIAGASRRSERAFPFRGSKIQSSLVDTAMQNAYE